MTLEEKRELKQKLIAEFGLQQQLFNQKMALIDEECEKMPEDRMVKAELEIEIDKITAIELAVEPIVEK